MFQPETACLLQRYDCSLWSFEGIRCPCFAEEGEEDSFFLLHVLVDNTLLMCCRGTD